MFSNELWSENYQQYILSTTKMNNIIKFLVEKESETTEQRHQITMQHFKKKYGYMHDKKYSLNQS